MYSHPSCALHNSIHVGSDMKGACVVQQFWVQGSRALLCLSIALPLSVLPGTTIEDIRRVSIQN